MVFEFYTEDGVFKTDYADYCKSDELVSKIADKRRILVNLGLRILTFDRRWLDEHPPQKKFVEFMRQQQQENPLRFFLPHCAKHDDFGTQSHAFINDATNTYTAMLAGNRFGKSTLAFVKTLLAYGVIPGDPNWECFKDHGIIYREWTGPKEIGVASYNWDNIGETVWPQVVRAWTPNNELGGYATYEAPQQKSFAVKLQCGSVIHLKCMGQPQGAFESQALHGWLWDEQGTESKFDGAESRMKTTRSYSKDDQGYEYLTAGWHTSGLTPHKLPDRPDTGAGTFIHRMYTGEITKGMTCGFHQGSIIDDVPDWIYSEREKQRALDAMTEAEVTHNKKAVRQIRSRLYGEFEVTGGMVYDEFDADVHVIPEIPIQASWCAFRCGDHGRTNPSAWLWCAVTPENDLIFFRELESVDKPISATVEGVIAMSGNTAKFVDRISNGSGALLPRFVEEFGNPESERYMFDVLDGRSFRKRDDGSKFTLGDLYKNCGLRRLRPAPLQGIDETLPLVRELLRIDPTRKHIITGELGAPRVYFVGPRVPKLIRHIQAYRNRAIKGEDGNQSEKPREKDDHDLDAMRYGIMMAPKFVPWMPIKPQQVAAGKGGKGYWIPEDQKNAHSRHERRDVYTGY